MNSDWLEPGGTFIDFEWHSFEEDGPLEITTGDVEESEVLLALSASDPLPDEAGEPEQIR